MTQYWKNIDNTHAMEPITLAEIMEQEGLVKGGYKEVVDEINHFLDHYPVKSNHEIREIIHHFSLEPPKQEAPKAEAEQDKPSYDDLYDIVADLTAEMIPNISEKTARKLLDRIHKAQEAEGLRKDL